MKPPGLPGLSPPCEEHAPTPPLRCPGSHPEPELGPAWPLTPGSPGSCGSPSAHLARLVELFLQPRHRHSAFRSRTSRRDPANRRNSASDRLPGAAESPRTSAGPVGTASAALLPAPRPRGRSLSLSRARSARILHGNRTLPALDQSEHARAPCRPDGARALPLPWERLLLPANGPGRV